MAPWAKLSREDIALTALVAAEGVHAFSAFNPSIFTIRTFGHQTGTVMDIRAGEVLATIFALALGTFTAVLVHHPLPIFAAGAAAGVMIYVYEWSLRSTRGPSEGGRDMRQGAA